MNRIDFYGKAYNDSFIGKISQKNAEKVAERLALKTVKEVQREKLESLKDIRKFIKVNHDEFFTSLNKKHLEQYYSLMKEKNITVKPVFNNANQLQGFRYLFKGNSLKGSEVHRSMSINKLKMFKKDIGKRIKNSLKYN